MDTVEKKGLLGLNHCQTRYAAKGIFFAAILGLSFLTPEETRRTVQEALSGAYISVSTFVAFTLAIFYVLEHALKLDTDVLLKKYERWQVPIAAFMGALPGCGGAIIVMTQYVTGRLGFGSVVAVLTSTMGDAAFLLIAREPQTALLVYCISLTVGIVSGYIVEVIHGRDFLRKDYGDEIRYTASCGTLEGAGHLRWPWLVLMAPGLALGIGNAVQADTDIWFGPLAALEPSLWIGFSGSVLAVLMWALTPNAGPSIVNLAGKISGPHMYRDLLDRVALDTNFVTVWVISAFLLYELILLWSGFDMEALFSAWQPMLPLIAILIGFLPGCGPQILVTTFYLNGLIPLSAQLGNAISNDGDALFPAIAMAPKAAILATLYTAVPALLVAYGWYFLMET